jgi:hypothetical protein
MGSGTWIGVASNHPPRDFSVPTRRHFGTIVLRPFAAGTPTLNLGSPSAGCRSLMMDDAFTRIRDPETRARRYRMIAGEYADLDRDASAPFLRGLFSSDRGRLSCARRRRAAGCPKVRSFANASTHGGSAYSVGALAHFLKNRFYIAEVVYRGDIHAGEHAPIIDRSTFDAVEAKLAENVRARRLRVSNSPAILMGRIFDDRGNRMTPSHSNKDGVRHRYYVSHAMLQRRKQDAGRVARVPAIELEKIVVEAVRARLAAAGPTRERVR